MFLPQVYTLPAYYLTLFFFAAFGIELNLLCLLTGLFPASERSERFHQRLIHRHFALFHWWCEVAGLVHVRYHGFDRLPPGGLVLAANHPALIDITCLLARVPEAVCIFKPAIRRNPIMGAAARRAGYLASDGGHDLVRRMAEKVAAGSTLVVFPEGTRTPPGGALLPLKPGFVLIARRAGAPVQLVRITTNSNVLTKGRAWWRSPQLPARVDVTAGPVFAPDLVAGPEETAAEIEKWFRAPVGDDAACTAGPRTFS
jgi:1-acyl-sn-glycerol-3-phosphate acyltransferase